MSKKSCIMIFYSVLSKLPMLWETYNTGFNNLGVIVLLLVYA